MTHENPVLSERPEALIQDYPSSDFSLGDLDNATQPVAAPLTFTQRLGRHIDEFLAVNLKSYLGGVE
jgi:hypothetical protein